MVASTQTSQFLGYLDGTKSKPKAALINSSFKSSSGEASISLKDLTNAVNEAAKSGADAKELFDYLKGTHYAHLNTSNLRQGISKLMAKWASEGKKTEILNLLNSYGYGNYIRGRAKNLGSELSELFNKLTDYIKTEDADERKTIFKDSIAPEILNSDNEIDLNHPSLRMLRDNKALPPVVQMAMSLGLQEEAHSLIAAIKNGQNIGFGPKDKVSQGQIEFEMSQIAKTVSPETGDIYLGDELILKSEIIRERVAEKINGDREEPLVKAGQKLDFYKWIESMRLASIDENDKSLSEEVNRFIDTYTAVKRAEVSIAKEDGLSAEHIEMLENNVVTFENLFTGGSNIIPRVVKNLIQRGLDFNGGIDAKGYKLITAGAESRKATQVINQAIGEATDYQVKERFQASLGRNTVHNMDELIKSGKVTVYRKEGSGLTAKNLEIVHDSNPKYKNSTDVGTFGDAARDYQDLIINAASKVSSKLTNKLFGSDEVNETNIKTFWKGANEARKADGMESKISVAVKEETRKSAAEKDMLKALKASLTAANGLLTGANKLEGVQGSPSQAQLDTNADALVSMFVRSALGSSSTQSISHEDLKTILAKYNGVASPENKIQFADITAAIGDSPAALNTIIDKLNTFSQNATITAPTSSSRRDWAVAVSPAVGENEKASRKGRLNDVLSHSKISEIVKHFVHPDKAEDQLKNVNQAQLQGLIEANEDLQNAMIDPRGSGIAAGIETFDDLKKDPIAASAEAAILFSDQTDITDKTGNSRAQLTVFLGIVKRALATASQAKKDKILDTVVSKLFDKQISREAEESVKNGASQDDARKEAKATYKQRLEEFLEGSEIEGVAGISTTTAAKPQANISTTEILASDNLEVAKAKLKQANSAHADRIDQLREDDIFNAAGDASKTLKPDIIINGTGLDLQDLTSEMSLDEIKTQLKRNNAAQSADLQVPEADIDALTEKQVFDTTPGAKTVKAQITLPATQTVANTGINEMANLISSASLRRLVLKNFDRSVNNGVANVVAARISTKVEAFQKDNSRTIQALTNIKDVLEASANSDKITTAADLENEITTQLKAKGDDGRSSYIYQNIRGISGSKHTQDSDEVPENLPNLLERYLAMVESLLQRILPSDYQAKETEIAGMKKLKSRATAEPSKSAQEANLAGTSKA